jgi:hypothetical protein
MRVFVYYNLHRRVWSIKALSSEGSIKRGRVFAHASNVQLIDCTLKVSEAGRQRVIRERRKNVHAGVVGELVSYLEALPARDTTTEWPAPADSVAITYNPYIAATFFRKDNGAPVTTARNVVMHAGEKVRVHAQQVAA